MATTSGWYCDDQRRESVEDLLEAEFQGFARIEPDGSGGEAGQRAAIAFDNAKAGVFAATIDAQHSHERSLAESERKEVSKFQGFKVKGTGRSHYSASLCRSLVCCVALRGAAERRSAGRQAAGFDQGFAYQERLMEIRCWRICLIAVAALLTASGAAQTAPLSERVVAYRIEGRYDAKTHTLDATEVAHLHQPDRHHARPVSLSICI